MIYKIRNLILRIDFKRRKILISKTLFLYFRVGKDMRGVRMVVWLSERANM